MTRKEVADYSNREFLKDWWLLLANEKLSFVYYTLWGVVSYAITFLIPFLLGKIVDFFTVYKFGDSLNNFYWLLAIIAVSGSFQVWLRFYTKFGLKRIGADVRKKARVMAISKLIDLDIGEHEKENTGSKIQKISSGSESIARGVSFFSNDGLNISVGIIGAIILFLFLDLRYLLFGIGFLIIYLYAEYRMNKRLIILQDKLNEIKEKVSGKIHESASNILTVKSLGLKKVFEKSTEDYETKYYKIWMEATKASQFKTKSIKIFSAIAYAAFLLILGLDVVRGAITVGSIVVFATYFAKLRDSTSQLTDSMGEVIEIKSGVRRIMKILGRETIERESGNLLEVSEDWKEIKFENVNFRYKERQVLKNLSLNIKRNEKVGVVGPSGCGKSTLAKILIGLYKPQSGKVMIDNHEIFDYKQSSVTNKISIVLQDSEMFNMSLRDNLTISSVNREDFLLNTAIDISQMAPVIKKLPNGLGTLIGEKGYKMSGGERQRLGIARAIYRNADVIIMDEATSHLDSKTESIIQSKIKERLRNKTMIIIAHRLSTLRDVDRIIVMDKGNIIEEGKFDDLIRKRGAFYKLYRIQKRD
jgi:ABC-type multidrug transport system fused ATPase/permease subunit